MRIVRWNCIPSILTPAQPNKCEKIEGGVLLKYQYNSRPGCIGYGGIDSATGKPTGRKNQLVVQDSPECNKFTRNFKFNAKFFMKNKYVNVSATDGTHIPQYVSDALDEGSIIFDIMPHYCKLRYYPIQVTPAQQECKLKAEITSHVTEAIYHETLDWEVHNIFKETQAAQNTKANYLAARVGFENAQKAYAADTTNLDQKIAVNEEEEKMFEEDKQLQAYPNIYETTKAIEQQKLGHYDYTKFKQNNTNQISNGLHNLFSQYRSRFNMQKYAIPHCVKSNLSFDSYDVYCYLIDKYKVGDHDTKVDFKNFSDDVKRKIVTHLQNNLGTDDGVSTQFDSENLAETMIENGINFSTNGVSLFDEKHAVSNQRDVNFLFAKNKIGKMLRYKL